MKIKKLVWEKFGRLWVAKTSASHLGTISIVFEDEKYWAIWPCCKVEGYDSLEEVMNEGQNFHETFLKMYLED